MPQIDPNFNVSATMRGKKKGTVISPEATDPMPLFNIIEKVGEGSYGEIYKAMSKSSLQIVALKIIDLEKTEDDIEDLLAEVDFQAKCDSPYLAKYCGAWMWDNKLTIAMEFLGGGNLDELIKNCQLSEQQCAFVIREILRSLFYLHKTLKIHRDIKPANVLFENNGSVKLADFGVAAQMTLQKSYRDTFVGTPLYLAPEIITSDKYGGKVDVWSLGIMAIEIATGKVPRLNQHPMDIIYAIPVEPAPTLPQTFSQDFQDFVSKCLTKDHKKRPSSADLIAHPFIQTADSLDKSIIKKSLETYRIKKNDQNKTTTPTMDQNDWWFKYTQASQAKKEPSFSLAGPSAVAKASVRPEIGRLNVGQTYGKKKTARPLKPLFNNGPISPVSQIVSRASEMNMNNEGGDRPCMPSKGSNSNSGSFPSLLDRKPTPLSRDNLFSSSASNNQINSAKVPAAAQASLIGAPLKSTTAIFAKPPPLPKKNSSGSSRTSLNDVVNPNPITYSPNSSTSNLTCLTSTFRAILSPGITNSNVSNARLILLKLANEIFTNETKFSEVMDKIIEVHLNPLMNTKVAVWKETQIKTIFNNLLKVHTFTFQLIQTLKVDLSSYENDSAFEKGILQVLEWMASEAEQVYGDYCGGLCKTLWETQKLLQENLKLKEFFQKIREDGGVGLFEVLALPVSRVKEYSKAVKNALKFISHSKLISISKELDRIDEELSCTLKDCEELIQMLLQISDIPPTIILKPKQKLIMKATANKLKYTPSSSKVVGKSNIYLMKDSVLFIKVLKDEESIENFSLANFLETKKGVAKMNLKYRRVIPIDFAEFGIVNDQDGCKNIFSITLQVQKGKTTHFSALDPSTKQKFINLFSN